MTQPNGPQSQVTNQFEWENPPVGERSTREVIGETTAEPSNEQLATQTKSAKILTLEKEPHAIGYIGVVALALVGCMVVSTHDLMTNGLSVHEEPKTAIGKINEAGRDLANGVITILEKSGSDAKTSSNEIYNKVTTVGSDGKPDTEDDVTISDSYIVYDPSTNTIKASALRNYPNDDGSPYSSMSVNMKLSDNNPLTLNFQKPNLEDFKEALAEGNPVEVTEMESDFRVINDPPSGPSAEFDQRYNNVIIIDQNIGGGIDGVVDVRPGNGSYDATTNRFVAIIESTIQDLTK